MNLLLVHGFWDTGNVFRRLQRELTADGHRCFAPTLHPRDGRHGLADLARKLAAQVDEQLAPGEPLVIIGFSMGCLVARYYLQNLRGARPVAGFFALSGPLRGTYTAWLYPGQGTRDMRPGSRFIRELEAGAAALAGVPVHTYYTPLDLMILPVRSSRLAGAQTVRVWALLHRWVPVHPTVAGDIRQKLARLDAEKKMAPTDHR